MDDITKRHPIGRAAAIRFLLRSHARKMKAFARIAGARNRSVTVAAIRIADQACRESVESMGIRQDESRWMINRKDWSNEGIRGDVEYLVLRGLATVEPHEDGGVMVTLEKIE